MDQSAHKLAPVPKALAAMTTLATLLLVAQYGCWSHVQSLRTARRSFIVKDDRFVKDDAPINVKSGSIRTLLLPHCVLPCGKIQM